MNTSPIFDTFTYQELARRTAKDMGTQRTNLIHAAVGIASGAGEFVDCIKKHIIYGKQLDHENAVEELGDVLWFISLACDTLGITMASVMAANIDKLALRYPDKYTDEAAIARADKVEDAQSEFSCPTPNVTDESCLRCITGEGECINKTHPIEVGNWGIPAFPDSLSCNCLHGVCMGRVGVVCKQATVESIGLDNLENNK